MEINKELIKIKYHALLGEAPLNRDTFDASFANRVWAKVRLAELILDHYEVVTLKFGSDCDGLVKRLKSDIKI